MNLPKLSAEEQKQFENKIIFYLYWKYNYYIC
jgi:hypothetical protein